MQDIVLVTIDCWRYDAPERMPRLQELTDSYGRSDAICQAPATRGAFPAILSSHYYPQAYDGFDSVRPDVRPLPAVLADAGYTTGGFIGSNPFLSTWAEYFDRFWNDEMTADVESGLEERLQTARSQVRHVANYLRLRGRVTARDVTERAREWYTDTDGPRFLWLHLMDVHIPFFPGLRRAREAGLLDAYRAHLRFMRDPESATDADMAALERLYWQSMEYLDEQLPAVFEFLDDDAIVVLLGDHGEEFEHDGYGHARLYDETVRVPVLASPPLAERVAAVETLRQLDVAPTILDVVGLDVPADWEGTVIDGTTAPEPAFMVNHSPQFGRTYTGVRTSKYKVMRTSDADTGELLRTEAYDLQADPGETNDIYGESEAVNRLEDDLDVFLARDDIEGNLLEHDSDGASQVVEDRLNALGYK